MNKIIKIFFILIIFVACKKDDGEYVANVYVNFYIEPNSTMYSQLNMVGGWVYVTGGVRGIVLYRIEIDKFIALDRACPHDPDVSEAYVEVEETGLTLIDKYCGSKFIITDGSVISGPSKTGLKQYRTLYDGVYLHVFN